MSLTGFVTPDVAEGAEATLRHVLEAGVTVINTASFYGAGENHRVIGEHILQALPDCNACSHRDGSDPRALVHGVSGRVIKDFPHERVMVASKWGPFVKPDGSGLGQDYSRAGCRGQCEQSLQGLGVDCIDLYIVRGPCKGPGVLEEAVEAMKVS